ncbi:MAG: hypothetical protein LBN99_06280 [Oscillospiraceae bacterium]|jgi:hypothetical protein|nr:hypothetical protein [Oscillospiraceae bacterium]
MRIFAELIVAAALLFAMAALWRETRRAAFTPCRRPRGAEIFTVIRVSGDGDGLERTVGGLIRMYEDVGLRAGIVIEDAGLDGDGARVARMLARDNGFVILQSGDTGGGEGWRVKN